MSVSRFRGKTAKRFPARCARMFHGQNVIKSRKAHAPLCRRSNVSPSTSALCVGMMMMDLNLDGEAGKAGGSALEPAVEGHR